MVKELLAGAPLLAGQCHVGEYLCRSSTFAPMGTDYNESQFPLWARQMGNMDMRAPSYTPFAAKLNVCGVVGKSMSMRKRNEMAAMKGSTPAPASDGEGANPGRAGMSESGLSPLPVRGLQTPRA